MTNPYSGQIFSELVSGNLFQPDQITGPFICIVGAASSGPSYVLRRVTSAQDAATLFESGGDTDTDFIRDIALALQEGGSAITLYAMRIGGKQGSLTFTQEATGATLKLTPAYGDSEVFEKYKVVLSESQVSAGTQRILVYDDELDTVIYDSDLIIVPDLGLMKVELSSNWNGWYSLGLDSQGEITDIDGDAPTMQELWDDLDTYQTLLLSGSHSNSLYKVVASEKVDASDGKNLSKPEMYAALEKAYSLISTRYMDYIVPSGAFFDAANITDTQDGRDIGHGSAIPVYNANDIDWSSKPTKGDVNDILGYGWQYKYKGTTYIFMSTVKDIFSKTTVGDDVLYVNTTDASVVGTDIQFMPDALKTLLNALKVDINTNVSYTTQADVASALTSFDTTNSSVYGQLFPVVIDVANALSFGDAKQAAEALIDNVVLNLGLEITLSSRVKCLTYEDSNGEINKIKKVQVQVLQSLTDSDGASLQTSTAELSELESEVWDPSTGVLTFKVRFNSTLTAAVPATSVATSDLKVSAIKSALEASDLIESVVYVASTSTITVLDDDKVFPQVSGADVDVSSDELTVGGNWLTHKELLGEDIPSKVWSKFLDEGSNGQFREISFGHQLASFCYHSSTSYHMCLGFISFSKPSAFNKVDLANYMGALPEYQGWAGKLSDEAVKSVGEGILGNKFLGGSLGYRGTKLKGGSNVQGYAFGGLICTKGLSLPNKSPYGISQGDEKLDANKASVDIGRHIVVSAAWPICSFSLSNNTITARHNISALLAAKIYTTPVNQEPFGEVNGRISASVLLSDAEQQLVADGYAADCRIARITMLDQSSIGGNTYITNISTAAHWSDDYKRISTIRCVNRVVNGLRTLAKRYIGSSFTSAMISSLQSAINGYLKSERDVGVHQGAIATLSFSRADRINGNLQITLKMVPPFALETITITTSVAADASEL